MFAPRKLLFLVISLFCLPVTLSNPRIAEGVQFDLSTSVNNTQMGSVLPDCTGGCPYDSGVSVQLVAVPSSGYVFDDWTVDCGGTNPSTSVTMTGAKNCIANFSSCGDLPVMREGSQFPTFQEAYTGAANNDSIELLATSLAATLRLDRPNIAINLKGGSGCGYSGIPSFTTIQGKMIITGGTATVENLIVMPVVFFQNDLTGDWDTIGFQTGAKPGWSHFLTSVDSSGSSTLTSYQDSAGGLPPPPGSIVASIDPSGTVTATGPNSVPSFSGTMSSDKALIIATQTSGGSSYALFVYRKRFAGLTYSSADIDNINFAFHDLHSGGSSAWAYGTAQTDGSGNVTILTDNVPSGPITPPAGGVLQIDANGIVTATNPTFYGLMTIDKEVIFNIATSNSTPPPTYRLGAFLLTGQTFIEVDLAGIYDFHRVDSGSSPLWAMGTFSVDTGGTQTYQFYQDSSGSTVLPATGVLTIDASGAITKSSAPSFHGRMAYNKDLFVRTQNQGTGTYGLAISIK